MKISAHIPIVVIVLAIFVAIPSVARAQTATFNDNPDNPLPQTQGDDLETVAQQIESSEAAAYQFKNEGIFGCNQVAGANASAGTLAAIGGVYVPVNDAAVTLNTGILVYKECVLRPLQNRLRESAMSSLFKKQYTAAETGREGNAQYVQSQRDEESIIADKTALTVLTDGTLDSLHPSFQQEVKRYVAASYRLETRTNDQLTCKYVGIPGDRSPVSVDYTNFQRLGNPACNPYFAAQRAKNTLGTNIVTAVDYQRTEWDWGRGFYAKTDNSADPLAARILTPSSVVQESYQQILNSPVEQLQSANDIGQMIGALFAGVTTQALTDSGGLAGLARAVAGQPSYLEQVAKESSQGVVGAAANAALQILNASRQIETRYLGAMNAIAGSLTQAINQLRSAERACWELIIPEAQEYAQCPNTVTNPITGVTTCTGAFSIQPATSTAFSQQVIDSQISSLAQAAVTNIDNSRKALGLIDQLIVGVTNTNSLTAQRLALQQLDNLVAQQSLHSQYDATNAEQQRDDIAASMTGLVEDTARAWGDSTDPTTGWCNINNSNVIQAWAEQWRN